MDESQNAIREFVLHRPKTSAVYGYGSSLFKQAGQVQGKSSMIDLIFIVENLKRWHSENMQMNPDDYSLLGKLYIKSSNLKKLKGPNKITYLSYIKEGKLLFKYGVMELEDFLKSLKEWDSFFVAGRFQKPVVNVFRNINVNKRIIDNTIEYNRKCALRIACLFCDSTTNIEQIFMTLCGLSYRGDIRMKLAENPDKVKNIVNGSMDILKDIYYFDEDYITLESNNVIKIDHEKLLKNLSYLPKNLTDFLSSLNTDYSDLDSVRINIDLFFSKRNRKDSASQAYECFKTNGIVKSIPYVLAKMNKRFKRK